MERPPRQFAPAFRAYVGNLPWQADDSRLVQLFSEHGEVVNATVVFDRETGRSRGFGFVTMASKEELDDAISALDGQVRTTSILYDLFAYDTLKILHLEPFLFFLVVKYHCTR